MISIEISRYLDTLRFERNVSREDFVDGVISLSQYKRYLSGENTMSFETILNLTIKLGLNLDYVLDDLDIAKKNERQLMAKLMNHVVNLDFDACSKIISNMNFDHIIEYSNQLLYQYSTILFQFYQKRKTETDTLYSLKKLVDYPQILKIEALTIAEFVILGEIMTLLSGEEQLILLKKFEYLLNKPNKAISGNNEKLILMLLVRIIKTLGILNRFEDALKYCKLGISICKSIKTFYALDYFYYYATLCYSEQNNLIRRDEMIHLTIHASSLDGNPSKKKKFLSLLEKDFNIKIRVDSIIIHKN